MSDSKIDKAELVPLLACGKVRRGDVHPSHRWRVQAEDDLPDVITVACPGLRDQRPHSRACGIRAHEHGPECSTNCPTCGGHL